MFVPCLFSLLVTILVSISSEAIAVNRSAIRIHNSPYHHNPYHKDGLSFSKLKQFIVKKKVKTIEDLLKAFQADPKMRVFLSNFTMMYESKSSQRGGVDEQHPRIIAFKDRLILAFTGDPRHRRSFESLEIIEFDPATYVFRFHEASFSNGRVSYSENEQRCQTCHGGRPIWGSYVLWPGAYGSVDDAFGLSWIHQTKMPKSTFKFEANVKERVAYLDFMKNHRMGRYALLNFKKNPIQVSEVLEQTIARYLKGDEPFLTKKSQQSYTVKELRHEHKATAAANNALTRYLNQMNFARIMKQLESNRLFPKYAYALAGAIEDCRSIESFFPVAIRNKHERTLRRRLAALNAKLPLFKALLADTEKRVHREQLERFRRYKRLTGSKISDDTYIDEIGDNRSEYDIEILSKVRYVLDGAGMSTLNWALRSRPRRDNYAFFTGSVGIEGLLSSQLVFYLKQRAPFFIKNKDWIHVENQGSAFLDKDAAELCGKLKELSLAQF